MSAVFRGMCDVLVMSAVPRGVCDLLVMPAVFRQKCDICFLRMAYDVLVMCCLQRGV